MKLSVLDQSTAAKGRAQDGAIRETLELARLGDALGYHRFWLSEHHNNNDAIVGTAPEVLIAAIAATTRHAGTKEQVAARLDELARRFALDEIVVVTWTHDPAPRRRSYELLAEAFDLVTGA